MGDQRSVNVTYSNQVQGFLSLTAASSRAIKAVVLFPSHHPVTCLHRLVSVLGMKIYSGGQRTDGCTVDMKGGGGGRRGGQCWDCRKNQTTCGAPLVARMRSYELLTAFNSEIVIACGSFITTGRQESKQSSCMQCRGGDTMAVFMFYFQEREAV